MDSKKGWVGAFPVPTTLEAMPLQAREQEEEGGRPRYSCSDNPLTQDKEVPVPTGSSLEVPLSCPRLSSQGGVKPW